MDILAHGLWSGAVVKAVNKKISKPLNFWKTVWWGIFPDLFAFTVPFLGLLWHFTFYGVNLADIPGPSAIEPPPTDTFWFFRLAAPLYHISHSAVIFVAVFGIVWLILRRPVLEMTAWLLHIFIDIPTHSYRFFPTPFLWPLSEWKFNGFSWGTPWFMVFNYTAIIILYFLLRGKKKNL